MQRTELYPQHINLLPRNKTHGHLQFNRGYPLQFLSLNFILKYSQITYCNSIILLTLCITNCCIYTFQGEGILHCHNSRCLRPLILLTKLHILRAGPSFRPIYFIIMSELSNSNALPSISCKKNKGTTGSPSTTTTISPLFHGQWLYHVV